MAKNDLFSNLTAVADRGNSGSADARRGQDDQFYRPAAPSKSAPAKARSSAPREIDTGRSRRAWPAAGAPDVSVAEEENLDGEPFLRSRRRLPVRRGIVPKTRTGRILFATVIVLAFAVLTVLALSVRIFCVTIPASGSTRLLPFRSWATASSPGRSCSRSLAPISDEISSRSPG